MSVKLTSTGAPAQLPVTLDEAKRWLRIDTDDTTQDQRLFSCIEAATLYCQKEINRQFITATYELKMDWDFYDPDYYYCDTYCEEIRFPWAPLQSVSSVVYVDTDGNNQTWSSSNYVVDTNSEPGRLLLAYNTYFPVTRAIENAVTITFLAGYGTQKDVPEGIKNAILTKTLDLYQNRGEIRMGTISNTHAVQDLLSAFDYGVYV